MSTSYTSETQFNKDVLSKRYRYIHIIAQRGVGFIESIVNLFRADACNTDINEHLFVTSAKQLYDDIQPLCNAVLTQDDEYHMITHWAKYADTVFVHGFHTPLLRLVMLSNRICCKIVWRTWGHDIVIPEKSGRGTVKYIAKKILFWLYARKVRRFKAIGIANATDAIKVRKAFGDGIKTIKMPYTSSPETVQKRINALEKIRKSELSRNSLKIMIGHSGFEIDRHIPLIDLISKYKDENITVSIPLVYGRSNYIEKVKAYATGVFGNKCEIITEMTDYISYAKYLNTVDIAIMDMQNSAALGNISLLLYLNKKIFLNKKGDIAAAFSECGLNYDVTESLISMDFNTLKSPLMNSDYFLKKWSESFDDAGYGVRMWNQLFELLITDETEGTTRG